MKLHNSHLLIIIFAAFITIGGILLSLPIAANGTPVPFLDALFMSTSAMCVTGLAVIDISTKLTTFGQVVILALIQLGGLGIMTFSTVFLLMLGKSISFRERTVMTDMFSFSGNDIESIVKYIFFFTLLIEGIGAVVLTARWWGDFPHTTAIYYGIFHSISAFCNSGLSLFSDSLVSYIGDPVINITFMLLIIFGGLGFIILREVKVTLIPKILGKRGPSLSLHSKMAVWVTFLLIVSGTLLFIIMEGNNTLSGLPLQTTLLASMFQSVTSRTAGFNTLSFANMTNATIMGTIMLMFIGASPGSTGGGVKTTTFGVLLAVVLSRSKAREEVSIFKRTLSVETVSRAIAIVFASFTLVVVATFMLMITEA
ncbi:MAG: hypothetical protein KKC21_02130, partial [Nitrospinae bacterium]|nr:hypothetical protein [Nitrospinota bacterium]